VSESIVVETSRAWLDVDLDALVANARTFQALVRAPLLPMVKANAYGLGAGPVAQALERVEPWGYGVATVEEGEELRRIGIARPIIVFTPLFGPHAPRYAAASLRPAIGDLPALEAWIAASTEPFHLEIDTGMRRAGVPWNDAPLLARISELASAAPGWEGIFTHFHSSDSDSVATRVQWGLFQAVLDGLPRRPRFVHAVNSGAGVADLGLEADFARPGIYLYGGGVEHHRPLPVAALRARVVATRRIARGDTVSYGATWRAERPTTIATLGIGYADGLPRALSSIGRVEIGGHLCLIAGRVAMDMTMVDVGDAPVSPGDVATLFGGLVSLDAQAATAGTIANELLTAVHARVVRRYGSGPTSRRTDGSA
jgi:alanine racemase